MDQETRLNDALHSLGHMQTDVVPEGFMDGVWSRAGEMAEAANARRRLALFAVIFVYGFTNAERQRIGLGYRSPIAYYPKVLRINIDLRNSH